jgi:hypothetical protein
MCSEEDEVVTVYWYLRGRYIIPLCVWVCVCVCVCVCVYIYIDQLSSG